jgi:hypothetical protein
MKIFNFGIVNYVDHFTDKPESSTICQPRIKSGGHIKPTCISHPMFQIE